MARFTTRWILLGMLALAIAPGRSAMADPPAPSKADWFWKQRQLQMDAIEKEMKNPSLPVDFGPVYLGNGSINDRQTRLGNLISDVKLPDAIPALETVARQLLAEARKEDGRPHALENLLIDLLVHPLRATKNVDEAIGLLKPRVPADVVEVRPLMATTDRLRSIYRLSGRHIEEDQLLNQLIAPMEKLGEYRMLCTAYLDQAELYLVVHDKSNHPDRDHLQYEARSKTMLAHRILARSEPLDPDMAGLLATMSGRLALAWLAVDAPERADEVLARVTVLAKQYSAEQKTGLDPRGLFLTVQQLADRGEFRRADPVLNAMLQGFEQPGSINAFFVSKLFDLTRTYVRGRSQSGAMRLVTRLEREADFLEANLGNDRISASMRREEIGFIREYVTQAVEEFGLLPALHDRLEREIARYERESAAGGAGELLPYRRRDQMKNLLRMARTQTQLGKTAAADQWFNRASAFVTVILDATKKNPDDMSAMSAVLELHRDLGRFYLAVGKKAEAKDSAKLSVYVGEIIGFARPERLLSAYCNAIGVFRRADDLPAAREHLEKARRLVVERKLDQNPAKFPVHDLDMEEALLRFDLGEWDAAARAAQRCIETRTKLGTGKHPQTALALLTAGRALASAGRWDDARRRFDEARRLQRDYLMHLLPGLSEPEQLRFLQTEEAPAFNAVLALAASRPEDAELVEASAAWVINGKAMSRDALSQSVRSDGDGDPTTRKERDELRRVRAELARLSVGTTGETPVELRKQLTDREEQLARSLQKRDAGTGSGQWIELADVRATLASDEILVEVVRLEASPARYLAWIIPRTGAIKLVSLGAAEDIEQAIAAVRKEFIGMRERLDAGEGTLEKQLQEKLRPLSRRVFAPIDAAAGGSRRWVVCPDGDLWLLPWQMLLTDGGDYVVQDYVLRYAITGRDLGVGSATPRRASRPLVLANPNYDLRFRGGPAPAKTPGVPQGMISRGFSKGLPLGNVEALPASIAEAAAIQPRLMKYAGIEPEMLDQDAALESAIKSAKAPRVLHLSTHGFFLPNEIGDGLRLPENPLLRCGLLFAGCNDAVNAPVDSDDGVLTGLEIVGLNLHGTDLVVLSACETALGDVHRGEGVAGLRQSFHLAGARSVVASAWKVPDDDTALLMVGLFDSLAAGKPTHESLREAQLDAIKQRRAAYNAAHPYYWAAFTVTNRR